MLLYCCSFSIKRAVGLVNEIDEKKLLRVLARVAQSLQKKVSYLTIREEI